MSDLPMDAVLCYVDGAWAYFTTQPLDKQWGDDWNDVPYEHNAGRPYEWRADCDGRGCKCVHPQGFYGFNGAGACGKPGHVPIQPTPEWRVVRVAWEGPFETPESRAGSNSEYSVDAINAGAIAWLTGDRYSSRRVDPIPAGVTLAEFIDRVTAVGGVVYVPARAGVAA